MRKTNWLIYFCIAIAAILLSIGYAISVFPLGAICVWVISGMLIICKWRGWYWGISLNLLLNLLLIVVGTYVDIHKLVLLVAAIAVLIIWDLEHFNTQLKTAVNIHDEKIIVRDHFGRLAVVVGLGAILGTTAMSIQIQLKFGSALLLGIVLIVALTRVIRLLRKATGTCM